MKLSHFTGIAALALVALSSGAQAQTIYGTFGFVPFGNITANNAELDQATSVTVPALELANTSTPTYMGHTNTFSGIETGPTAITLSTLTIANGGTLSASWTFAGVSYTFTADPGTIALVGSVQPSGNFLTFAENGTLSDGGSFVPQIAQVAGSFSQTANGGAVNGNFTFSTPPVMAPTPEPGAVALLAGAALSGAGFLVRRRK